MNKFTVIIILIICSFTELKAQWTYQKSGVKVDLYDVCFVDSVHGWAVGDSSTIISTNNGGESWVIQDSPTIVLSYRKVQFLDNETGYLLTENGTLLKSVDGGINWTNISIDHDYVFTGLYFLNADTGWISGTFESPSDVNGTILHTSDGGQSWTQQLDLKSEQMGKMIRIPTVEFLNDSLGWAIIGSFFDNFDNVDIYSTNDGGKEWNKIGETNYLGTNLEIINKDTLWFGGLGAVEISHDGGVTWTFENDENLISPWSILPINKNVGWTILYHFSTKESRLMYTTDGGRSWDIELEISGSRGLKMTNYTDKYLWIVGENGLIIRGQNVLSLIDKSESLKYYPLHIGNYWQYEVTYEGDFQVDKEYWIAYREVIGDTIMPNYKNYYIIKNDGMLRSQEIEYIRIDSTDGNVYQYDLLGDEELIDSLLMGIGDELSPFCLCFEDEYMKNIFGIDLEIKKYSMCCTITSGIQFTYERAKNVGIVNEDLALINVWSDPYHYELLYAKIEDNEYGTFVNVDKSNSDIPNQVYLSQNYPNPFNPSTKIKYSIPNLKTPLLSHACRQAGGVGGVLVTLKVYDILGREIATLVDENQKPGNYEVIFHPPGEGLNLSSGIYYYKLSAGNFSQTKKMILIK